MNSNTKIAFVGSGNMAEAMIRGLLRESLVSPSCISASGPRIERGEYLHVQYGISPETSNKSLAINSNVVVLSTKPQVLRTVLEELHGVLKPETLVVSIVAGASTSLIGDVLGHKSVVRAMPNTPAQIGQGITVWTATPDVSEEQEEISQTLLSSLGETVRVDDDRYLDMATALSGTGPAYVLLFMEAMIDAGVHLGFSRRISEQLVLQTMKGTVEYVMHSSRHPAALRNEVTSPGGTSAAALYQMEKGGLRSVISRAIWAAYQRSIALGGGKHLTSPTARPDES